MMKIKKITVFLFILLPAVTMAFLTGEGQEESFIDFLKKKLDAYNNQFNTERTWLLTDRYVYRPGEDLWFKGFVSSSDNKNLLSHDFFVRLLNSRGEEIIYRRYPLMGNEASGNLVIPRSCIPGKYWLVAYSGWMKNQCPEEAFRKEILISKYFEKRFRVETSFDKELYYPGDTLNALIRILDASGKPLPLTDFGFMAGSLNKSEEKGSGKTDVKGKARIAFVIPDQKDILMITYEVRSRKVSGNYAELIPVFINNPLVEFFPEGGNLVAGIKSKVGIKATDKYGLPRLVRGMLVDRHGKTLDSVYTGPSGLGVFTYTPGNDSCFLQITFPAGVTEKYPLPGAMKNRIVLQYLGVKHDSAVFSLTSGNSEVNTVYCAAVMNSKMIWAGMRKFTGSSMISLPINNMHPGILQMTVFNQQFRIAAERNIYIRNETDKLRITMEREIYQSRQRVSLMVQYPRSPLKDLAMSVSLQNLSDPPVKIAFNTIRNSPSCNFDVVNPVHHGDLALLTSDYNSIDWNDVILGTGEKKPFESQDGLTGVVYDKKENVSPHAKVRVTHFPNFRFYETQTDENGFFKVSFGSDIIDYKFLNVDAYDATGKTNLNARIDYNYVENLGKILTEDHENSEEVKIKDLRNYGEPELVYVLRYGPGKFRKSSSDSRKKYDPYQYAKYTDVMDIIQDIQPYRLSDNKIIFTGAPSNRIDTVRMEEAIIVINGVLKGNKAGALKNIIPSDITNINISTSLLDVHKYTPLNFRGVIEITTIQGTGRYRQSHVQMGPGIMSASEKSFYSPDYAIESSYSADNRRTLYWNPKIEYQGNSMVVTFYTSDIKGTFYGHIAGMDINGYPVEGEFTFEVE